MSSKDNEKTVEAAPAAVPVGEAMRRAVLALGEVVVDDELAAGQLRQLAESYEDVTKAQTAYDIKMSEAKVAKQTLESVTSLLLEKVRDFTHPKALPLFDQHKAEKDRAEMAKGPVPVSDVAAPVVDKAADKPDGHRYPKPARGRRRAAAPA